MQNLLVCPFKRFNFRAYENQEIYVPALEMVNLFLYRVCSVKARARIKITVETGASASEVRLLTWGDFNAQNLECFPLVLGQVH